MLSNSSESFIKDILHVVSSNILVLLGSVLTGLVVPSMLGTTNYGYYRMFMLYSSYAALLHFGFVDGVLLKIGGKDFKSLNKIKLRANSQSFMLIELVVAIIISLISFIFKSKIYSFLFITVGLNIFLINMNSYYQFIAQATLHFKEYSIRNSIQSSLNIIITLIMWILYKMGVMQNIRYSYYIIETLFVTIIMFGMCVYSYHNITFGKRDSLKLGLKRIKDYCKTGIYLTISYQVSNLILIIDNQIVSVFFKASVYGKYSFSYSIANTMVIVLNAVATVLLPHLKRDTFKHIINIYQKMISSIMIIVYFALLGYFPLCILIKLILPEYVQSLNYLRIFLPELGVTCSITMITFNYYNALNKSKFYFYMSMIILIISTTIDMGMYILFKDPILVALGSFISIFIWYIASEYFLIKWYHIIWCKNFIYMILMISLFFIMSIFHNEFIGFILYLTSYLFVSIIMFRQLMMKEMKVFINKI